MEWAQMACHRCLVYLGDLGKDLPLKAAFKMGKRCFLSLPCEAVAVGHQPKLLADSVSL